MEKEFNDFEESLAIWEAFEKFVAKQIYEKYNRKYTKNKDKYWVDLLWDKGAIEVKLDTKSDYSWNYFIEVLYKNRRSWLLKYPETKYYCIWTFDEFYGFKVEKLKEILLVFWEKVIWWDYNFSTWFLVKKEILKKHCDFNY